MTAYTLFFRFFLLIGHRFGSGCNPFFQCGLLVFFLFLFFLETLVFLGISAIIRGLLGFSFGFFLFLSFLFQWFFVTVTANLMHLHFIIFFSRFSRKVHFFLFVRGVRILFFRIGIVFLFRNFFRLQSHGI